MTNKPAHLKYRPDIDGLRAVAVLSVVIYHAFPDELRGGFAGVDVFFVISGFLISTILFQNIDRGTFSLAEFYSRRVRRIFPALTFMLFSVLVFGWFYLFPDELRQLGKHTASSAGFIQNFTLWGELGYFDNASEAKPLLHIWSLGIEEQFYFIWPLLLWAAGYLSERFDRERSKMLFYLVPLFLVFVISFVLNVLFVKTDASKVFYLPQYRFFEMALGGILSWLVLYKPEAGAFSSSLRDNAWLTEERLKSILSFLGFAILLTVFATFSKETVFPGTMVLWPVLATAFIIYAGEKSWLNRKLLSHRVAVWFGLISFPLYLWHWPLLSFGRIINGATPSLTFRFFAVVGSVLLSWFTVKVIEKPFRFGGNNRVKVATLCGLLLLSALAGKTIYKYDWAIEGSPFSKYTRAMDYRDERIPGEVICNAKEFIPDTTNLCIKFSHNSGPTNATVIGDSHAADKFHGMAKLGTQYNWLLLGNSSCPPVYGLEIIGADKQVCPKRMEAIIDYVAANKSIEFVVLAFAGMYFQKVPFAANHRGVEMAKLYKNGKEMVTLEDRVHAFQQGLETTLPKLKDKKIVMLVDVPELPFYPRDCLRSSKDCTVPRVDVEARQKLLREMIASIKSKFPAITVFDPIDFICSTDKCSYEKDGEFFYSDGHHLSLAGSDSYAIRFFKAIQ